MVIFQSTPRREASDGRLMTALALSCALHVLLLWPEALPRATQQAGQPLTATLRPAIRTERHEAAAMPAPVRSEDAMPAARPVRKQVVAAPAAPSPEAAPVVAAAAGERLPQADRATADSPGFTRAGGAMRLEVAAQAGDPLQPDADGIRAYRIGLAREARAYKQYPSLARERGWTGTAEVRVDVAQDGRPRQVLLARSSGHDILDREAVHLMSRAAGTAALPDSLRGLAFAVRLPVVFDIREMQ